MEPPAAAATVACCCVGRRVAYCKQNAAVVIVVPALTVPSADFMTLSSLASSVKTASRMRQIASLQAAACCQIMHADGRGGAWCCYITCAAVGRQQLAGMSTQRRPPRAPPGLPPSVGKPAEGQAVGVQGVGTPARALQQPCNHNHADRRRQQTNCAQQIRSTDPPHTNAAQHSPTPPPNQPLSSSSSLSVKPTACDEMPI